MKIEENNGSTVFRRATEYHPGRNWSRVLIGRPLSTADAPHQTISKFLGLAVFSADAMSSVAYGPQEILIILAVAGAGAFHLSVPIAIAIWDRSWQTIRADYSWKRSVSIWISKAPRVMRPMRSVSIAIRLAIVCAKSKVPCPWIWMTPGRG